MGKALRELPGPILITGHTGFKGTWLTFLLEHLDVKVIGLSLAPERNSLYERANRSGAISEEFIDIRDSAKVAGFVTKHQPSAVIHMAAQPLVLESYKTPRETFETNVMGTANILDAAFRTTSTKAVVVITTDKVYRNDNSGQAFSETDALAGKDPYSASKVGTESVVAAWQHIAKISGGPGVIAVRAGNVIGGGDWAENRLLPDLIRGLIAGGPIQIRNPSSTRPWQHVLDPLYGYLMALEALLNGSEITSLNFGPDFESLTVKEVTQLGVANWPTKVSVQFGNDLLSSSSEAINLHLNSTLATRILGWKPHWNQHEAVTATINWWDQVLNSSVAAHTACYEDILSLLKSHKSH